MTSGPLQTESDALLAQQCHQGDAAALAALRGRCHGPLTAILLARGASPTEAADLLADIWADCVPGNDERPSLLEKFSGKCTLQGWLAAVATNRFIDLKRKLNRRGDVAQTRPEDGSTSFFEKVPAPATVAGESVLVDLLRASLEIAFGHCSAEGLLMLRLVYLHGLSQREVARLWACHEAKISRTLKQTLEDLQSRTLKEAKALDPWLEISWEDFLDLCQTQQVGFL